MKKKVGSLIKNFFIMWFLYSVLFALGFGFFRQNFNKVFSVSLGGGFLFALICFVFILSVYEKTEKVKKNMLENGQCVLCDVANHLVEGEAVGGSFFLTETELYFKSHNYNLQIHELIIPYSEISSVSRGKIFRSICIKTKGGNTEYFVVNNRKNVIKIMNELLKKSCEANI